MQTFIQFGVIGLGIGALYALFSQGLLIIYRGSGVLNFAYGAFGTAAAFATWDLNTHYGVSYLVAALIGTCIAALLGAATHTLVMKNLKRASPIARTVATLGILIVVQAIVILRYGTQTQIVSSWLPTHVVHVTGSITVTTDRIIIIGIALIGTAALWAIYKFTRFGLSTAAAAENQRAAASLGMSADQVATINWALGSALGGVAAILIVPLVQLQATTLTNLLLAGLAVALIANFTSFPIALGAGLAVGVLQTELIRYVGSTGAVSSTGVAQSVPFGVILLVMVVRGRGLPLRDFFLQRLPSVGTGRLRPQLLVFGPAVPSVVILVVSAQWQAAFATTFGVAIVLLSIVVLTGYAGQISLGQYVLAGMGAYITGRLSATIGVPFIPALIIGIIGTIPVGLLFALPAVRTRGVNLAIVTLGMATAIQLVLFESTSLTGGLAGTIPKTPSLFGLSIDPIQHPERYALFALVMFVIVSVLVANVRRGRSGRRMLAVRTNERAAAALGVNVLLTKLYAFGLSAAIASAGGTVLAFASPTVIYSQFDSLSSISDLAWAVIGGVGYIGGALIGALFAPGSLGAQVGNTWLSGYVKYLPLLGGVSVILMVLQNQDGAAKKIIEQASWFFERINRRVRASSSESEPRLNEVANPPVAMDRVKAATLKAQNITVSYGSVTAVNDVSFVVRPASVFGLIGPNGAGKTTVIDAITGFTALAGGRVVLDGTDISARSVAYRSRNGISRSFQSLELFDDMTVLDNLRAAADPHDFRSYIVDLFHPINPPLPKEVVAAIREFGLEAELLRRAEDLSYGQRRLLAIARAVATKPGVLLLDEPAAGLSDHESAELAHLVRRLADDWGIAVLLVEHDINFVMSVCDEISVLDFGHIIASGSPSVIRSHPAVILAYLGDEDEVDAQQAALERDTEPSGTQEVKR